MNALRFIAWRHGVVIGSGWTRAEAAATAATAARVSSVDIRPATPPEWRLAQRVQGRELPESEQDLLRAIGADIHRVRLALEEFDESERRYWRDCPDAAPEVQFVEYAIAPHSIDDDLLWELEQREKRIAEEIRELRLRERQMDLFAAAVPA